MKSKYIDKKKFEQCVKDISVLLQNTSTIFQMMEREHVKQNRFTGSQSFLMIQLLESQELSINEIAEIMNLEKSSVSRMVKILIRDDLLQKSVSDLDKRIAVISLTENGKKIATEIKKNREKYYRDIILNLPKGHVREVMNSTEILVKALKRSL